MHQKSDFHLFLKGAAEVSLSSTNGDPGGSSGLPEVSGLQSVAKPEILSLSEPDHTKIHS